MSVRTVNVGMLNPLKLQDLSAYLEGPPFYANLRIKLTISGSRSHTDGSGITREETMSFSKEVTLDRVEMPLAAIDPTPASGTTGPANVGFDLAEFSLASPASGYFCCATLNYIPTQIGWQVLSLFYASGFDDEVCGTWSETGHADPADDDSGDILISAFPSAPNFWQETDLGFPEDYRTPHDRWGTEVIVPSHFDADGSEVIGQDITGWDDADWRSKLGVNSVTYNETAWYDPAATTTVSATFEWELS